MLQNCDIDTIHGDSGGVPLFTFSRDLLRLIETGRLKDLRETGG
jgi:hypothetical protein